jgi:hypothetical protein
MIRRPVDRAASRSSSLQTIARRSQDGRKSPEGECRLRFMMLLKSDAHAEAGTPPDAELLEAMGRFNQELINAGVLLAGEGLKESAKGARVKLSGDKRTVADGPFVADAKELIAGYWLLQVKSKAEAIEWAKRCPNPYKDGEGEIEVRQVFDL